MEKMKVTYEIGTNITRVTGKNSSLAHNRGVDYCIMTVGNIRVQVPLSEFPFLKVGALQSHGTHPIRIPDPILYFQLIS